MLRWYRTIRTALHALRRPDATADTLREATADIDGEVVRLNRLVNDVLDFAKPIRFELSPIAINTLCRESAAAALASGPGAAIVCELDPAIATLTLTTDPERLRIALVNLLVNARHAVNGNGTAGSSGPGLRQTAVGRSDPSVGRVLSDPSVGRVLSDPPAVTLTTSAAADHVRITVADRGPGIASADLGQIFDPFFTTKRGGTGLGLPIARNIVEGLGGTIAVSSAPGAGTTIVIALPFDSRPPS